MAELNCDECLSLIPELALGVVHGRERADALAHVEHCPTCQHELLLMGDIADRLVELTPSAEPPAGFETRVLTALAESPGPVAAHVPTARAAHPSTPSANQNPASLNPAHPDPAHPDPAHPDPAHPDPAHPDPAHPDPAHPDPAHPDPAHPDPGPLDSALLDAVLLGPGPVTSRPAKRSNREPRSRARGPWFRPAGLALVAAVVAAAVGIGGWAVGHHGFDSRPAVASASGKAMVAELLADHRRVGEVVVTGGTHPWVSMAIETSLGNQWVTCQVRAKDGKFVTLGSFSLDDGSGYWAAAIPATASPAGGARVLDSDGSTVGSATLVAPT